MKWFGFIKQFLKSPRMVGAIAPSGPHLANRVLEGIDFERCNFILEYGPGTGAFTDRIVARKRPETLLMVIEYNYDFYKKLKERYAGAENVRLIHGSAVDVHDHLKEHEIEKVDCVVSGLPFASFPKELSQKIFAHTRDILEPSGVFIAFQYSKCKMGLFRQYFSQIGIRRVMLNLPPAYVLVCSCGY